MEAVRQYSSASTTTSASTAATDCSSPPSSALDSPKSLGPPGAKMELFPPSTPRYTFPAFLLTLLTALESDPSTISAHLSNLVNSHAAPSAFTPTGSSPRPAETDAIVAVLTRLGERLRTAEKSDVFPANGTEALPEVISVPGKVETIESVKIACGEHLRALKTLHAEELRRSQVSHDEEVRCVRSTPRSHPALTLVAYVRSIAIVTSAIARGE